MNKKYLPKLGNSHEGIAVNDDTAYELTIIPCFERYIREIEEYKEYENECRFVVLAICCTTYKKKYWISRDDGHWIDSEEMKAND